MKFTDAKIRREYLYRRHQEGLSYRKLAQELGISPGRVGQLVKLQERILRERERKTKLKRAGAPADSPIEILDLSIRTFNALRRYGVQTVGDAMRLAEQNFEPRPRNLGALGQMEVRQQLKAFMEDKNGTLQRTD